MSEFLLEIAAIAVGLIGLVGLGFYRNSRVKSEKRELEEQQEGDDSLEVSQKLKKTLQPKSLSDALKNTKQGFFGKLQTVVSGKSTLGSDEIEEIEEILYTSDLGPQTVQKILAGIQSDLEASNISVEVVSKAIRDEMFKYLDTVSVAESLVQTVNKKPVIWMIVGVNGAGKTTTIGKLANRLAQDGKKVMIAAGDTFRAAAKEQLAVWSERAKVEIFAPEGVTSPSGLAFDAAAKAKTDGFDVLIVDTAGRLHTQVNLMEELKKVKRVIGKSVEGAPDEVLLVLDSNQGQNALIQAREFHSALDLTGVILTKLDGTAKGGVAVGVACELSLPIRLIGVGEGIEDLRDFSSKEFVESII